MRTCLIPSASTWVARAANVSDGLAANSAAGPGVVAGAALAGADPIRAVAAASVVALRMTLVRTVGSPSVAVEKLSLLNAGPGGKPRAVTDACRRGYRDAGPKWTIIDRT